MALLLDPLSWRGVPTGGCCVTLWLDWRGGGWCRRPCRTGWPTRRRSRRRPTSDPPLASGGGRTSRRATETRYVAASLPPPSPGTPSPGPATLWHEPDPPASPELQLAGLQTCPCSHCSLTGGSNRVPTKITHTHSSFQRHDAAARGMTRPPCVGFLLRRENEPKHRFSFHNSCLLEA